MIVIEPGISINKVSPEMAVGHSVVVSVFGHFGEHCIVARDLTESGSLAVAHNTGNALDYRVSHLNVEARRLILTVLLHVRGDEITVTDRGDTIHVEYDKL